MLIIKIEPNPDGGHVPEEQSHRTEVWMDGYIEVPAHLREKVMACAGYCDLQIEDGVLVNVTPHEPPKPSPEERYKSLVQQFIHEVYSVDDELALTNAATEALMRGEEPEQEYLDYRAYVDECKKWAREEAQ